MTDQQPPNPDALRVGIERSVRALERALTDSLPAVRDTLEFLASAFTEPDPDRPGQTRRRRHGTAAQHSPYGPSTRRSRRP